jgi:DNA modification methylase
MAASTILHGNNIELLRTLPDCSIDSIVTDPPYELGFMGKKWDSSGIAYSVELWSECLRVLKHGGHLLAFSGSRTYHRMVVAIEDAGFEIRDQIMWVYGSGFPKSLDISKAIDKSDAKDEQQQRRYKFTEWVRSQAVTAKQIDEATNTMMGNHYTTHSSQPAIMTREHLEMCRHLFNAVPEWVETECNIRSVESKQFASREVIGVQKNAMSGWDMEGNSKFADRNITTPATDEAQQWSGWGTALKPAHEPIVMARKPIEGTVANNVLKHGVGGINIEASRIASTDGFEKAWDRPISTNISAKGNQYISNGAQHTVDISANKPSGRFPANFIHDGSEEVLALFPDSTSKSGGKSGTNANPMSWTEENKDRDRVGHDDSGSAARFFYCAKASKAERNAGLQELPEIRHADRNTDDGVDGDNPRNRTNQPKQNFHPTVKPIALMRYLVRLVTPPNGKVLDPFAGSGTTLVACVLEGFESVGMEMTADYLPIIQGRVAWAEQQVLLPIDQPSLFD